MEDLMFKSQVKLYRDQTRPMSESISKTLLRGCEHNIASAKRKKRTLNQLSTEERICIAKLAATKVITQREIAERHQVSVALVSR